MWFTPTPFQNIRLNTSSVKIGSINIGNGNPVLVQSMANTPTHDVNKSVNQAIEIINAGGELVRFTVINSKDAEALKEIKINLKNKGFETPLVADVHFNPNLADIAAKYVEKVRINPGNYLDKRATFTNVDFSDEEYQEELIKLEERFGAFITICKEHQTAIRIGTNHGSLSDRIMSRYGDSPEGMVEATMEFLRICKKNDFNNVVISLKSSNTRVMVQAYRLLSYSMQQEDMIFPLHLGVTEAGNGEDGRIKSAVGIGALMNDGLGDTIRVSLTEHPANEIPVGKALVKHFETKKQKAFNTTAIVPKYNPYHYLQREFDNKNISDLPVVVGDLSTEPEITKCLLEQIGFNFNQQTKLIERGDLSPDIIYTGEHIFPFNTPQNTSIITEFNYWNENLDAYPLFSFHDYLVAEKKSLKQNWVMVELSQLTNNALDLIKQDPTLVLVAYSSHINSTFEIRQLINVLIANNCKTPVVVQSTYSEFNLNDFQLQSAADNGLFFIDGLANGLWLKNTFKKHIKETTETAFTILQASRARTSKTEYISCPGCGRTLFELEKTLGEVKASTQHLKGLKIAVMGCIVNGPGEMADADYGYVGASPGKISLYKGKNLIKRNIDAENAVQELLDIIKADNKL